MSGPTLGLKRAAGSFGDQHGWRHGTRMKNATGLGPRQRRRLQAMLGRVGDAPRGSECPNCPVARLPGMPGICPEYPECPECPEYPECPECPEYARNDVSLMSFLCMDNI